MRRPECQLLRDLCPRWRHVTAAELSDERRERAADGGHEQQEIMQEQQRTGRAMHVGPLRGPNVVINQPHPLE
jgi:hypothetical protein